MKIDGTTLGLRVIALILDYAMAGAVMAAGFELTSILSKLDGPVSLLALFVLLPLSFVSPILFLGIPTGLKGRTVGKWICRLRVIGTHGNRIGVFRGCAREALKAVLILSHIGGCISLVLCLARGQSLQDMACSTEVENLGHLTKTQRNWRKAHGND